ncbi:curlin associated repeat-containing protein [Spirosoma linguale]|uniref:Curlin associated repeat protein n=1 Tax=Spirosoma linguale (strain ATCC 33905 / DSM 74 / LMG 10896 / Claus 1) TaxID=504472 RepID=D2QP65_SPILD|nr:Curlin associated repeat protein [Spirosoma linguale DSM 74]
MKAFILSLSTCVSLATTAFAQNNTVTLTQIGTAQEASVSQAGSKLTATVTQEGADQNAIISQKGFGYSEVIISQGQNTADNQATITQVSGGAGGSYGVISQVNASGNKATITQTVSTNGGDNFATITQGSSIGVVLAGAAGATSTNNQATITIEGSNNRSRILQVGDNNSLTTSQYGEGNLVKGVLGNPAGTNPEEATQLGVGNSLSVVQSSPLGVSFGTNTVNVYQSGMSNVGTVNQTNQ